MCKIYLGQIYALKPDYVDSKYPITGFIKAINKENNIYFLKAIDIHDDDVWVDEEELNTYFVFDRSAPKVEVLLIDHNYYEIGGDNLELIR